MRKPRGHNLRPAAAAVNTETQPATKVKIWIDAEVMNKMSDMMRRSSVSWDREIAVRTNETIAMTTL